ncbi:hypothetical protein GLOIN_2v1772759 [Rhizophagus clarus]|uniref:Uncharacterized protein n=1 Tax=Rhizophagus clarus TaxID=94130 RepID=A0A8H3LWR4_9GLOM|nr:hypothetical protein GLOIN_2v1772759 [Rhizophagus clarus]
MGPVVDSNEAMRCEYISIILHTAVSLLEDLIITFQANIIGEENTGRVDYAIISESLEEIICITEGKPFQATLGVCQNLLQCRSACDMNIKINKKNTEGIYSTSRTGYRIPLTADVLEDSTELRKNVKRILKPIQVVLAFVFIEKHFLCFSDGCTVNICGINGIRSILTAPVLYLVTSFTAHDESVSDYDDVNEENVDSDGDEFEGDLRLETTNSSEPRAAFIWQEQIKVFVPDVRKKKLTIRERAQYYVETGDRWDIYLYAMELLPKNDEKRLLLLPRIFLSFLQLLHPSKNFDHFSLKERLRRIQNIKTSKDSTIQNLADMITMLSMRPAEVTTLQIIQYKANPPDDLAWYQDGYPWYCTGYTSNKKNQKS